MAVPVLVLGIPALGMLVGEWLPFVNGPYVWFGLPSMFVWFLITSGLMTPALGLLEWLRHREERRERS